MNIVLVCWWKIADAESLTNETATTLQLYLAQMDLAAIFNGMYVYFIAGPRQGLIRCRSNVNNRNRNSYPRNRICQIYKASAVHELWPGFCPNNTRSQVSANRKSRWYAIGTKRKPYLTNLPPPCTLVVCKS